MAGTLSIDTLQLGDNASAANNFFLKTNADGTGGLYRGNAPTSAGTVLAFDASNRVSGVLTSGTAQATTSGTSIDFTSIPSWVKRITVMLDNVSTNGTDNWLVQIGDSGGIEATGYTGTAANVLNGASPVNAQYAGAGFVIPSGGAANVITGSIVLTLLTSTTWVATGTLALTNSANIFLTGGSKALSATLDRVRLTTTGGVNTFDAGSVNILYEG